MFPPEKWELAIKKCQSVITPILDTAFTKFQKQQREQQGQKRQSELESDQKQSLDQLETITQKNQLTLPKTNHFHQQKFDKIDKIYRK